MSIDNNFAKRLHELLARAVEKDPQFEEQSQKGNRLIQLVFPSELLHSEVRDEYWYTHPVARMALLFPIIHQARHITKDEWFSNVSKTAREHSKTDGNIEMLSHLLVGYACVYKHPVSTTRVLNDAVAACGKLKTAIWVDLQEALSAGFIDKNISIARSMDEFKVYIDAAVEVIKPETPVRDHVRQCLVASVTTLLREIVYPPDGGYTYFSDHGSFTTTGFGTVAFAGRKPSPFTNAAPRIATHGTKDGS